VILLPPVTRHHADLHGQQHCLFHQGTGPPALWTRGCRDARGGRETPGSGVRAPHGDLWAPHACGALRSRATRPCPVRSALVTQAVLGSVCHLLGATVSSKSPDPLTVGAVPGQGPRSRAWNRGSW
jgi:hypothetical protein